MMVPRAYAYSSPNVTTGLSLNEKRASVNAAQKKNPRTSSKPKTEATAALKKTAGLSPSPSTPSKPVIIPTRTRQDGRRKTEENEERERERKSRSPADHDRSQLSPSASALLAMTTIPEPRRFTMLKTRRINIQNTHRSVLRNLERENSSRSLSSSNPKTWEFLLSPPDDGEIDDESVESDATVGRFSSVRSMSTESMPSLEADSESLCSSSNPETPGVAGSSRGGRKSLSTSIGEECASNHPLLPPSPQVIDSIPENASIDVGSSPDLRLSPTRHKSSFKSNLTASFRAVRSAARSFSNFASPPATIQQDDLLSSSLLSLTLPYAVEKRPLPSSDPPGPALRRYLNPLPLSPSELHFHPAPASPARNTDRQPAQVKASIQLQAYQPGARVSEHASAPPIFLPNRSQDSPSGSSRSLDRNALDTEDAFATSPSRQREPRENSDFLRVIVLEMNMRKCGKLGNGDPGRARLWLPARQSGKTSELATMTETDRGGVVAEVMAKRESKELQSREEVHTSDTRFGSVTPARWAGISAE